MRQPKVSIIIPVYNGADYMREAIDSALAQTYPNCEIIVVNDGSTDNSEEIAKSYGDKIRYFQKENGGVSTALNVGIQHMTGEYFAFLPHDDIFLPDKIEKQVNVILQSGDDMTIVMSGWYLYHQDSGKKQWIKIPIYYPQRLLTRGVASVFLGKCATVTILLPKKYFDIVGMFDPALRTSQDHDMWFRTFRIASNIVYMDEPLIMYREHEAQGTQIDPTFIRNCIELAMDMLQKVTTQEIIYAFGSEYMFYHIMKDHYTAAGWQECLNYLEERWGSCVEPIDADKQRQELCHWLTPHAEEIYLYCAGRNGIRLQRDLWMRGIEIRSFSDTDHTKHGMSINGVTCIPPEQLPKDNSLVIVTNDHSGPLAEELKRNGFQKVLEYQDIAGKIFDVPPIKERI